MTILFLFLLFVMLSLGPSWALLASLREGQVNITHAPETMSDVCTC